MAISYDVCVYIAYDHLAISFGYKLGHNLSETLRISYDNRKVIVYVFTLLTITLRFLSATNLDTIFQRPCGYRMTTARLSCSHCVIFTTSLFNHTITLLLQSRKESVRLLCNCRIIMCMDLNGHPCSSLDAHLNCVSKQ